MEPFTKALEVVAEVMRKGAASHPDNDWVGRGPEYHLGRAEEHLRLWHDGDQLEDHMSHAATRLLMALTLREFEASTSSRSSLVAAVDLVTTGSYHPSHEIGGRQATQVEAVRIPAPRAER
jgi:dATP/dGTP diphosphohydrolase